MSAVFVPPLTTAPPVGPTIADRPEPGFGRALGRTFDRPDAPGADVNASRANEDAPVDVGRQDVERASDRGLESRSEHAGENTPYRRIDEPSTSEMERDVVIDRSAGDDETTEVPVEVDAAPVDDGATEVNAAVAALVAAIEAPITGSVEASVEAEVSNVDGLAETVVSTEQAPNAANVAGELETNLPSSGLSSLIADPTEGTVHSDAAPASPGTLGSPISGDLPTDPDATTPAPVQPLAAASPPPESSIGSMTVTREGVTEQVAAEPAGEVVAPTPSGSEAAAAGGQGQTAAQAQSAQAKSSDDSRQQGNAPTRAGDVEGRRAVAADPAPEAEPVSAGAEAARQGPPPARIDGADDVPAEQMDVRGPGGAPRLLGDAAGLGAAAATKDAIASEVATLPSAVTAAPAEVAATAAATPSAPAAAAIAGLERAASASNGNAVVQRIADVARALENAPPPRSVVVELESMRGLRLEIRLGQAGSVHVLAHGSSDAVQPLASLGRDLADALAERGMNLGDFQTRDEDGRDTDAGTDGNGADRNDQNRPKSDRPGIRAAAAAQPNPGRTLTGLRL